jgi:hypothetical protein
MLYGPNAANRTIVGSWQNITIKLVAIAIVHENKDHNNNIMFYQVFIRKQTLSSMIINMAFIVRVDGTQHWPSFSLTPILLLLLTWVDATLKSLPCGSQGRVTQISLGDLWQKKVTNPHPTKNKNKNK